MLNVNIICLQTKKKLGVSHSNKFMHLAYIFKFIKLENTVKFAEIKNASMLTNLLWFFYPCRNLPNYISLLDR